MSFTRESVKDIEWRGAVIPANTPFFMVSSIAPSLRQRTPRRSKLTNPQNLWAANHDPTHFKDPMSFIPSRFIGVYDTPGSAGGTQHFAYGAGTRNCAGAHLANRELYAIFSRIILAFKIKSTTEKGMFPELDTIECNAVPTSMVTQPKPFKIWLEPRDRGRLEGWIEDSVRRTAGIK